MNTPGRILGTLTIIGGLVAVAACAPPPDVGTALAAVCVQSPATGEYFGTTLANRCDPSGAPFHVVDEKCGPLLESLAPEDECVAYYDQATGRVVIKRRASMTADDVMTGGPYR